MEEKFLKDYENKTIKYLIKSSKFVEAILTLAIGVMQILISSDREFDKEKTILYVIFIAFDYAILILLMLNALAYLVTIILDKISGKNKFILACLCCCCIAYAYLMKVSAIFFRCFSLQECCWKANTKFTKILIFTLRILIYLMGFSLGIVNLVNTLKSDNEKSRNICIAIIVCYVVRIFIMILLFYYCTLFDVPLNNPANPAHGGFMRLEEMGSSKCLAKEACAATDLEHVLKCHSSLHKPHRKCSPCYFFTGRKNYYIGFHQTKPEYAIDIAVTGFKCGKSKTERKPGERPSMYGGGIYFARSVDMTDRKGKLI
jgi:hypothetical protein